MIRDDETQRLVNYAKGLGLSVTFSSKKADCSAVWYLDNSGIVIYKTNNVSKISTVLSLIHEIGHAKHCIWENNREEDKKFEKALDHVDEAEESGEDSKKRHRKTILDNEIAGTQYWEEIYHDTNMKFDFWRLKMAMEYDMWQYQVFYDTGKYPVFRDRVKKRKELRAKYNG
jgi:hypothetical protein